MAAAEGKFIVLEGIDGAGTTTQAQMLHDYLVGRGLPRWLTREPTDGPLGGFIRDALSGAVRTTEGGRFAPSESALCLLFAADRLEHSRVIEEMRAVGRHVVCDRYIMSSIAYQSRGPDISAERVIEANRGCARPDITFFLDVRVEDCLRRLEARGDSPTIYEKKDLLEAINRNYETVRPVYEQHFGRLIEIDGMQAPEQVQEEIASLLARHLQL
jgi:dTMP kinase